VKHIFEVMLSIPVSPSLSPDALRIAGVNVNTPLSLILQWKDAVLEIKVSGGQPFSKAVQPYLIIGVTCNDCIVWQKSGNEYRATIPKSNVTTQKIGLKDRLGQFLYQTVPFNSTTVSINTIGGTEGMDTSDKNQVIPKADKKDISYDYIKTGDSLFTRKQFSQAKVEYEQGLSIKPNDPSIVQKIARCDEELVKAIPRIKISGGTFTMGTESGKPAEGPPHQVSLTGFYMSKTEVTVGYYALFCKYTGRPLPPGISENNDTKDIPVTGITWDEAMAFCQWVGGRLPSEAEWEYAAGGGSKYLYSGGNNIDQLAWYKSNTNGKPAFVARKAANQYGLYDMTGNVSEWCFDWYDRNYYSKSDNTNPKGAASGTERVVRGGGYNSFANSAQDGNQLRITYRNSESPGGRYPYIGFRVVWEN
jgi:formylglycine-generating enzyme